MSRKKLPLLAGWIHGYLFFIEFAILDFGPIRMVPPKYGGLTPISTAILAAEMPGSYSSWWRSRGTLPALAPIRGMDEKVIFPAKL
ncbi:MAG TPA: hypothetical protein DEA43_04620 [Candidatus Moranbacteria bacterium]|nr:hypothetical protein [Candidatus Moranbacteria bacterium]HBT46137.1 hypothetical protein [Candidatus Moranbacteria bacterium]